MEKENLKERYEAQGCLILTLAGIIGLMIFCAGIYQFGKWIYSLM